MEKFLAVIVIVFPGILAIHDNRHDVRTFNTFQAFVNGLQGIDHILRGCLAGHAGIGETNFVRNDPVAEEYRNLITSFALHIIRTIEGVGVIHHTVRIPGKAVARQPQACHKHRLAGLHPLVSSLTDQRHDFLRHGTFSGPKSADFPPKDGLVHFHALREVESGILRFAELLVGHGCLGVAHQCQVRIIDQRQNRMGVRRGRDFQNAGIL